MNCIITDRFFICTFENDCDNSYLVFSNPILVSSTYSILTVHGKKTGFFGIFHLCKINSIAGSIDCMLLPCSVEMSDYTVLIDIAENDIGFRKRFANQSILIQTEKLSNGSGFRRVT